LKFVERVASHYSAAILERFFAQRAAGLGLAAR